MRTYPLENTVIVLDSRFQLDVLRNLVADAMEDFQDQIRQDVLNLHMDMVKQFLVQEVSECTEMVSQCTGVTVSQCVEVMVSQGTKVKQLKHFPHRGRPFSIITGKDHLMTHPSGSEKESLMAVSKFQNETFFGNTH